VFAGLRSLARYRRRRASAETGRALKRQISDTDQRRGLSAAAQRPPRI